MLLMAVAWSSSGVFLVFVFLCFYVLLTVHVVVYFFSDI